MVITSKGHEIEYYKQISAVEKETIFKNCTKPIQSFKSEKTSKE